MFITSIDQINTVVQRISTNENFIVDIHTPSFSCNIGDKINIDISENMQKKSMYTMIGYVYFTDNDKTCVSSGGLISVIPKKINTGNNKIYIHINKNNVRNRSKDESKSNKRKK